MIRHTSFSHGWFYHYRLHQPKADSLCEGALLPLKSFMEKMFEGCPDHYFLSGPRSSALRFDVDVDSVQISSHPICSLAVLGIEHGRYRTAHSNVEVYMLENDSNTVAVELPIWLLPHELDVYRSLFDCEDPLSGHIDLLRIEDNHVWIWDYKPHAVKEKYAKCQLMFYALMLSKRTGLPLSRFRCGYFDESDAFVFKPEMKSLAKVCTCESSPALRDI
jgi:hypothetical protein